MKKTWVLFAALAVSVAAAPPQPPEDAGAPYLTSAQMIVSWNDPNNPAGTTYRVRTCDLDTAKCSCDIFESCDLDAGHMALPTKASPSDTSFSMPLPSPDGQNISGRHMHVEVRALYQGEVSAPLIIQPDPLTHPTRNNSIGTPTVVITDIGSTFINLQVTGPGSSAGENHMYVWFRDLFTSITGATRQTLVQLAMQAGTGGTPFVQTITGLKPASTYILASVWFNGTVEGTFAPEFANATITAPADPSAVGASLIASSSSITVNWQDSENPPFAVTPRFRVCRLWDNYCTEVTGPAKSSDGQQSFEIPGLDPNTAYSISLRYLNNNDFEYAPLARRPNGQLISFGSQTTLLPGTSSPPVASVLHVTPVSATLGSGGIQAFHAEILDQHGVPMTSYVNFNWTHEAANDNQLSAATGQDITFTAGTVAGEDTLTASLAGLTGSAVVTVNPHNTGGTLRIVEAASASPNPTYGVSGNPATSQISVLAEASPSGAITYHWTGGLLSAGSSGAVQFANPSLRQTTATFTAGPGLYSLTVVATGPGGLQAQSNVIVDVRDGPPPVPHYRVVISPRHAVMHPGESLPFTAESEETLSGVRVSTNPIWSAAGGGVISPTGRVTALATSRTITITAHLPGHDADSVTVDVIAVGASMDVSGSHPYPVPWKSTMARQVITFIGLAPDTTVRIYTDGGREVRSLYSVLGENIEWNMRNAQEERVASGVYFYKLDNPTTKQTKKGKLVVIY